MENYFMFNIKQKFLKIIISFACLISISSCEQAKNSSNSQNKDTVKIIDVAILMPTSGQEAALSQEYIKMIKIGLSDSAKTRIRTTTYDTSDVQNLDKSLDKILDIGTDIIIGPIYSEATKIVSNKIEGTGVIVLSLSNNPVLATKQVFVCGHAPMRQLEQITNYFLKNNYKNYIALLPSGRHSNLTSKVLSNIISSGDGTLSKVEFYEDNPEDIEKSIKAVDASVSIINEDAFDNTKQPVILISDDTATLETLYTIARKYNLDKQAIVASDVRADLDSSIPFDVTFTGSLNMKKNLALRASKVGIKHISSMHAIAYDLGKMVGTNIGTRYQRKEFLGKLNSEEPFIGVSGDIHFVDSIALRKYDIIKKTNNNYVIAP